MTFLTWCSISPPAYLYIVQVTVLVRNINRKEALPEDTRPEAERREEIRQQLLEKVGGCFTRGGGDVVGHAGAT
jgi:hypothetical protein